MAVCTVLFLLWNTVIDYSTQSQLFALCRFAVKGFVFFLVKPQCEYTDESQLGPLCMSCSGMYTQQLNCYYKTMLKNSALELRARSALRACFESREFWDGVCSILLHFGRTVRTLEFVTGGVELPRAILHVYAGGLILMK